MSVNQFLCEHVFNSLGKYQEAQLLDPMAGVGLVL